MKIIALALIVGTVASGALAHPPSTAQSGQTVKKAAAKSKTAKGKLPKKALCVICVAKDGARILEPVKDSIKYKGKTYYFCANGEKAEFISNPTKYAKVLK
jgi:YHS domain-containing protein